MSNGREIDGDAVFAVQGRRHSAMHKVTVDVEAAPARLNAGSSCLECGRTFAARQPTQMFCSVACRRDFNNRRQQRGAELYDLYMALRFDRPVARRLRVLSMLNRLSSFFREQDRRERSGRRSWTPPDVIVDRAPHLRSQILERGAP